MENRLNKNQCLNALAAVEIEVPVRPTVAQLKELFAKNRQQVEAVLLDQVENENENGNGGEEIEDDDDEIANEQNNNDDAQVANGNRNVRNEENHGDQLNGIPQRNQGEPDHIERELANLRRQHEILRLRREIELMQRGERKSSTGTKYSTHCTSTD